MNKNMNILIVVLLLLGHVLAQGGGDDNPIGAILGEIFKVIFEVFLEILKAMLE